jgi:hypothetical protein
MKRVLYALALACLAGPAIAQQGAAWMEREGIAHAGIEQEGRALINQWVAAFNRGDADALAALEVAPDTAKLATTIANLRADSFGKLDVYSAAFCGVDVTHGKAIVKFARIYTFGGKMNDDEARIFDISKTDAGWRIMKQTDAPSASVLSC